MRGNTTRYNAWRGCARILDPLLTTAQYGFQFCSPQERRCLRGWSSASSKTDDSDPVPQWPSSSWQGQEDDSRPFARIGWFSAGIYLHDTVIIFFTVIFCRIRKMNFIRQVTWIYIIIAAWFCEQNSHLAVLLFTCSPFLASKSLIISIKSLWVVRVIIMNRVAYFRIENVVMDL